jgi:hypothetical protein
MAYEWQRHSLAMLTLPIFTWFPSHREVLHREQAAGVDPEEGVPVEGKSGPSMRALVLRSPTNVA